jgi:hypothetical protein
MANTVRSFPAFSLVELLAGLVFFDHANSARANLIVIRNQPGAKIFNELRDL